MCMAFTGLMSMSIAGNSNGSCAIASVNLTPVAKAECPADAEDPFWMDI